MYDFYKLERTRRTRRITQYIFVTITVVTLSVIPPLSINIYDGVICVLLLSPLLIFAYLLKNHLSNVAGTLLLLYITLAIFSGNVFYSTASNASYYYIAEYVMLLLVIDNRNKFFLISNHIHIGASILAIQLIDFQKYQLTALTKEIALIGDINTLLAIFSSLYLFYTYIQENIAKENYLILMHRRIITKNKIIENAQSNLETFIYRSSHNLQGPIRSIMGLYNISTLEDNPEKLKNLIELANQSAQQLDKELFITAQVFRINQHIIELKSMNLYDFVAEYYNTTNIETKITDKSQFYAQADVTMLTEGMNNLYAIFKKLRLNDSIKPILSLDIVGNIFTFRLTFDAKNLDDKYLSVFFAPYHKDLGFLYDLTSEPYICRRIMDKLHGDISIHKVNNSQISFTVASRLM